MTDLLLTWACSYLLHSSLLIGAVWAAERAGLMARLSTLTQEMLWRVALLGGLASATLPLLPGPPAVPPAAGTVWSAAQTPRAAEPRAVTLALPVAVEAPVAPGTLPPQAQAPAPRSNWPSFARLPLQVNGLALGLVALWWGGAVLMLGSLALEWTWLRRAVRRLPALADPRWQTRVAQMAAAMGVAVPALRHARLGWASPLLAPGRVLCLPAWCLDLPDDEARAVLGHELAHLRRHDPAWRLAAALLNALLWPQRLNRVAQRRLDLLAELACDAAAAAPAGQRLALAQGLLRCAEALGARPGGPALACGAATEGSSLRARVRRLLEPAPADVPREPRRLRWGLLAGLLAVLVALPAVVVSHTDAGSLLDQLDPAGDVEARGWLSFGSRRHIFQSDSGGSFSVRLSGTVAFTEDEGEVQTLDGRLTVRERVGGVLREMTLTSASGGRIERTYRLGREAVALDAAGQQWWAGAIKRVASLLTDPQVHARRLFERGGMAAVLADLEAADGDYLRRLRIEAALQLGPAVDAATLDRLIAATTRIAGAFERRETLSAIAQRRLAEPQQLAWLKAAAQIDGDFERREVLAALAPQLATTPDVLQAWQAVLAGIGGDFELRSALETQVATTPQPAVLRAALQAAGKLQGDFERRQALAAVAQRLDGSQPELVQAYLGVAAGIGGAFEKREALVTLLDRSVLPAAAMEQLIGEAERMDAGFERLQVLLRVADKIAEAPAPDAGLASRLRRAGRGLGDFERGQLEHALDKLG